MPLLMEDANLVMIDGMEMNIVVDTDAPMVVPPEQSLMDAEDMRHNSTQSRDPSFAASFLGASR